ncbi:MAG: cation-transporting P-type ATPase, partial [Bacillota bacterium]
MEINLPLEELFAVLRADGKGLTSEEANKRLDVYGHNVLETKATLGPVGMFLRFFANPLVIILLVSAFVSFFLGETRGSVIIIIMVLLSAVFQFFHEYRSHTAAAALGKRVAIHASALRDGRVQEIPLTNVVPGDIIHLSAGDIIPGDARLISGKDLYVNQASLTGESFAVAKQAAS